MLFQFIKTSSHHSLSFGSIDQTSTLIVQSIKEAVLILGAFGGNESLTIFIEFDVSLLFQAESTATATSSYSQSLIGSN